MIREILTYLILLILSINTYFIYFFEGYLAGMPGNKFAIITLVLIFLITVLFSISQLSIKRSVKKNSLRIIFLIGIGLFIASLYQRLFELQDYYFLWRWSQTVLYGILIILIISNSNKLYSLLKRINSNIDNLPEKDNKKEEIINKNDFL